MSPSLRKSMRIESFTIIKTQNLKKRKRHRTPGADGRSNSAAFLHRPVRCVWLCVTAASCARLPPPPVSSPSEATFSCCSSGLLPVSLPQKLSWPRTSSPLHCIAVCPTPPCITHWSFT